MRAHGTRTKEHVQVKREVDNVKPEVHGSGPRRVRVAAARDSRRTPVAITFPRASSQVRAA